jgi:hypothetical protein
MATKTPLALVKEKFGDKAKLVEAVQKLAADDALWLSRTNEDKGLAHVSNAKLLRLHATFSEVKTKGHRLSREALGVARPPPLRRLSRDRQAQRPRRQGRQGRARDQDRDQDHQERAREGRRQEGVHAEGEPQGRTEGEEGSSVTIAGSEQADLAAPFLVEIALPTFRVFRSLFYRSLNRSE